MHLNFHGLCDHSGVHRKCSLANSNELLPFCQPPYLNNMIRLKEKELSEVLHLTQNLRGLNSAFYPARASGNPFVVVYQHDTTYLSEVTPGMNPNVLPRLWSSLSCVH